MAINISAREVLMTDGAFDGDGSRTIQGLNCYLEDTSTGSYLQVDSVVCVLTDVNGDTIATLTTVLAVPSLTKDK